MSERFEVFLESNLARRGMQLVRLDAQEAEFVYILNQDAGQVKSHKHIMRGLYGPIRNAPDPAIIKVIARDVRRKLAPMGVSVEGIKMQGFRLVVS